MVGALLKRHVREAFLMHRPAKSLCGLSTSNGRETGRQSSRGVFLLKTTGTMGHSNLLSTDRLLEEQALNDQMGAPAVTLHTAIDAHPRGYSENPQHATV
jgi:hypothetical protein